MHGELADADVDCWDAGQGGLDGADGGAGGDVVTGGDDVVGDFVFGGGFEEGFDACDIGGVFLLSVGLDQDALAKVGFVVGVVFFGVIGMDGVAKVD